MKITLDSLNVLAIERIQLFPWVLCGPGNTYTLGKNTTEVWLWQVIFVAILTICTIEKQCK